MEKLLVLSSTQKNADAICALVSRLKPELTTKPITSAQELRRKVLDELWDCVLINLPLSDDDGMELAKTIAVNTESTVICFIKADDYSSIVKQSKEYGIMLVQKPVIADVFSQTLDLSAWMKDKINALKKENYKLEVKLEELKIISKAKCLLAIAKQCSEPEAHHLMEKMAMNNRLTLKECASLIIRKYSA